jgi:hypothetical protein
VAGAAPQPPTSDRKSAWRFGLGKLRTEIGKRLKWLPHIAFVAGAVAAFRFAPTVDAKHSPDRLQPWFIAAGSALVGIGLAVLFYNSRSNNQRALEYLGGLTVGYAVVGICVAGAGIVPWEDDGVYRYRWGGRVGTFAAFMTTTALVTSAHLRGERAARLEEQQEKYAGKKTG